MQFLNRFTWWAMLVLFPALLFGQFRGGDADGASVGSDQLLIQISDPDNPQITDIFSGGDGDGFSFGAGRLVLEIIDPNNPDSTTIFAGGDGDGFSVGTGRLVLEITDPNNPDSTNIFAGGDGDGFSAGSGQLVVEIIDPNNPQLAAIFAGGDGDGHAINSGQLIILIDVNLPLTLINFTARPLVDGTVQLGWITVDEYATDYFVVERGDGRTFTSIGELAAAGQSLSGQELSYTLLDSNPLTGRSFYRLRTVDQDGSFQLSPIVTVMRGTADGGFAVYPNPGTGEAFNLSFTNNALEELNISIFDITGRLLLTQPLINVAGEQRVELGQQLTAGIYVVRILDKHGVEWVDRLVVE